MSCDQKLNENICYIFDYKEARNIILRFKKYGEEECAEILAEYLADFLLNFISEQNEWQSQNFWLGFVPSHKSKIKKRGFEPNALLFNKLKKHIDKSGFNVELKKDILVKLTENLEQKGLSKKDRLLNVSGVFTVPDKIQKRYSKEPIIIFDDVSTSGATLKEAKRTILKHMPKAKGRIFLLTIANHKLS